MTSPYAAFSRTIEFRELMSRSFANLWAIRKEVGIYLGIAAVLAFASLLLPDGLAGLPGLLLYLAGQYWLFKALLGAKGLLGVQDNHFAAFFGLAVLLVIPIGFGMAAFVLPGLFLVARWITAPAFIVARGEGPIRSAGSSWQTVRGHTGKIMGAAAIMFVLASFASGATEAADQLVGKALAGGSAKPFSLISAQFFPLLLLGLSTATYEMLGPQDSMIEDVFG